jgi:hypothetical protein
VIRATPPATARSAIRFVISLPSSNERPGGCLVGCGCIKRTPVRPARRGRSFAIAMTRCRLDRAERLTHDRVP